NQAGCTLGGSKANKAPSDECGTASSNQPPGQQTKGQESSFSVYPAPFRHNRPTRYQLNYRSNAVIQFFDMRGNLVKTQKEPKASAGRTTTINADFVRGQQIYLVKVTTNKGTSVKSVVSGK